MAKRPRKGKRPDAPVFMPTVAFAHDLADVANHYRQRRRDEPDVGANTLYILQGHDVIDVVARHCIGPDADALSAAEVLKRVHEALIAMDTGEPFWEGWRQYAWRAIQLGCAVGVASVPILGAVFTNGLASLQKPATYAELHDRLQFSDAVINDLACYIRDMGVENWAAAVGILNSIDDESRPDKTPPTGDGTVADGAKPPLSPTAAIVYEILLGLPEYRALTGPQLLTEISNRDANRLVEESTLRGRIMDELKAYGVENFPKIGYRIRPDQRPPA